MRARLLFAVLVSAVGLLLGLLTRRRVRGLEHVPRRGGALVVCNHISVVDPLVLGETIWRAGRRPRGMATAGLFGAPVVGGLLRRLGFIPVARGTATAREALAPAADALRRGRLLMVYPEGGISRDQQWPMPFRTGAARLALETGVPVVPVAQWGAQRVWPAWTPRGWRWLLPAVVTRPRVQVLVGEPLHLVGDPASEADVRRATGELAAVVIGLLVELRGPRPDDLAAADRLAA
ncbi:lysophospholipid acyltransferase family protein [Nocardioides marmoraquaticus]